MIRDVATKNKDVGLPLLISNKDGNIQNSVCAINSSAHGERYLDKELMLPESYKPDSMDDSILYVNYR
jgi:hypothetical protein